MSRSNSWAHQSFLTAPTQCSTFPWEAQCLCPSPARQLPFPAPKDNPLYVLSASLPVSRLSLYSHAVSSDTAFFPITSCLIQTLLKAPFHASKLPRVLLPAGLDPHRGPSSVSSKWGHPSPSPTSHLRSHNTHFPIKSNPLYLSHRSFQKADKIPSFSNT